MKKPYAAIALFVIVAARTSSASTADAVGALHDYLKMPVAQRPVLDAQPFAKTPLSKLDAESARQSLWADHVEQLKQSRADEWKKQIVTDGVETMPFVTKTFGDKPTNGWNLYISLHGGGNTTPAVNDEQWRNQQILYEPPGSLYIAPRAPTNSWDLWHEPHVDTLIDRLIEDAIVFGGVDANRVYLMGYSAGGDGVYQLAPRMADRFAAASMMAGHPNDASPLGLRNLPFAIHVGALDNGYDRNKVAEQWKDKLDALQKADPAGYVHDVVLHAGRGHWMEREDRVALSWMAQYTRDPLPNRIVWVQGHATHDRFYWLAVPPSQAKPGARLNVSLEKQTIRITDAIDVRHLDILLNEAMLDLDRPVCVLHGTKTLFEGIVPRTISDLAALITNHSDPYLVFSARVKVDLLAK